MTYTHTHERGTRESANDSRFIHRYSDPSPSVLPREHRRQKTTGDDPRAQRETIRQMTFASHSSLFGRPFEITREERLLGRLGWLMEEE